MIDFFKELKYYEKRNIKKGKTTLMNPAENKRGYFRRFQTFAMNRMAPFSVIEEDSLTYWRVRILFAILFTGLLLFSFAIVPIIALVIKERLWGLAIVDGAGWIITIYLLISRRLKYENRATITLLLAYAIGLVIIISVGPMSGGPAWLFAFAVLTGVLLGGKAAIAATGLNAITLTIIGWLISTGRFGQEFPFFNTTEVMIVAGASFIILNAVAAISVAVLVKGLVSSHEKQRGLTSRLQQEQAHLIEAKKKLEIEVEERKQAEDALRESEEKYRNIVESIEDGYYEVDFAGSFIFCNDSMSKILGYSKDELIGMNNRQYMDEENAKKVFQTFNSVYRTKEPYKAFDWELIKKDGSRCYVETSVSIRRDPEGEPIGFQGIARDVTERKKAEEEKAKLEAQLQQALKMEALGILGGGIAHDFNNLLMGIQGNASLMLLDKEAGHPDYEKLENIEQYVQNGADLTKQLLGFARGGKYEVKPTDINDLIKKTTTMFGRTKKEITVQSKYEKSLWSVEVDKSQIEQVLLNIYVNAWQAMPGGGELYLQTENVILNDKYVKPFNVEPGNYVKISITDTGVGMDEVNRQRIFDPFFTTREMGRGTGLGLASAYGIIKNHGGFINVYSEKGEGTTFNIYLPALELEVRDQKSEVSDDVRHGDETILFVDDEEMIIDVGKLLLERLGYKVLTAESGKEAIEVYEENKENIHMVILDMIMPGMGGGKTYDKLKEVSPEIKVLLSSGYSINGQATEILERGCTGFIQKPFNIKELSQKLREILDN